VLASAERYKTDIESMGAASDKIAQLRLVTFRYRNDATGTVQYGLIAEEVAKVYPELVIRDDKGTSRVCDTRNSLRCSSTKSRSSGGSWRLMSAA
jgi:hypothetical protein